MFKHAAILLMMTTLVACVDAPDRVRLDPGEFQTAKSIHSDSITLAHEENSENLRHQTAMDSIQEQKGYLEMKRAELCQHVKDTHSLPSNVPYDIDYQHGDLVRLGSH